MQRVLDEVSHLSEKYNEGCWLIDNYNYRALAQGFLLDTILSGHVKVSRGRHGIDATIDGKKVDIELKSVGLKSKPSLNNLKGAFDPRYSFATRDRDSKVFKIEVLMLSGFYNEVVIPQASVVVLAGGMPHLHPLLENKISARVGKSHEMASVTAGEIVLTVPPEFLVCLIGTERVGSDVFGREMKKMPTPDRRIV
jgi:hypothetical protein